MQMTASPATTIGRIDRQLTTWLATHSVTLLRMSLGLVFLIFGAFKFIPGASPAEDVATRVVSMLSLDLVTGTPALLLVAVMETAIGLSLLSGRALKIGVALLGMATFGILAPLVLFPQDLVTGDLAPTLMGQYVFKDIVLAAAALLVILRERGARLILDR